MIRIDMIILSRISGYSTASSSDAAYIIGGLDEPNGQCFANFDCTREIIAAFKNGAWSQFGTLAKGRGWHGSISIGNEFMVIGGWTTDGRLVNF